MFVFNLMIHIIIWSHLKTFLCLFLTCQCFTNLVFALPILSPLALKWSCVCFPFWTTTQKKRSLSFLHINILTCVWPLKSCVLFSNLKQIVVDIPEGKLHSKAIHSAIKDKQEYVNDPELIQKIYVWFINRGSC